MKRCTIERLYIYEFSAFKTAVVPYICYPHNNPTLFLQLNTYTFLYIFTELYCEFFQHYSLRFPPIQKYSIKNLTGVLTEQ